MYDVYGQINHSEAKLLLEKLNVEVDKSDLVRLYSDLNK